MAVPRGRGRVGGVEILSGMFQASHRALGGTVAPVCPARPILLCLDLQQSWGRKKAAVTMVPRRPPFAVWGKGELEGGGRTETF